jgi:hypothetical protein
MGVAMRVPGIALFGTILLAGSEPAAQEAGTYTYDVHGRLVTAARTVSGGTSSTALYQYDPANNRTHRTVTVTSAVAGLRGAEEESAAAGLDHEALAAARAGSAAPVYGGRPGIDGAAAGRTPDARGQIRQAGGPASGSRGER